MKREHRNRNRGQQNESNKDIFNHRTASSTYHKRQYNDNYVSEI
jgi:hypothetical protein